MGVNFAKLYPELGRRKARSMDLNSTETIIVCQHEELLKGVKQSHAVEISVWGETSQENAESLTSDVQVANADSVMMSVEQNLIFAR